MLGATEQATTALITAGIAPAAVQTLFVPGRIEFLGKHTDYCGGRSLLCAVERGITFAFAPRTNSTIRIFHPATATQVQFPLTPDLIPTAGHWSNYTMTVARRVARNFPRASRGVDLAIDSNLPPAAGLSSSSALIVGMFLVLSEVNHLESRDEYRAAIASREDLAGYLGCIENGQNFGTGPATLAGDRGVGTLGGSQDHTAILCSQAGQLRQYGFFPVRHEATAPFPPGHKLVVMCSGVEAIKTGAAQEAYNRNPLMVRQIVQQWNNATGQNDPCLAAAIRSDITAPDLLRAILRNEINAFTPLLDRLNQFIQESERIIPAATAALRAGDLSTLGHLVDESQALAQRGLANQTAQTIFLAKSARELGATAASAFGAGFGGSVWAMTREAEVKSFAHEWMARYRQEFPDQAAKANYFTTAAGAPATIKSNKSQA